jgi:hypothetical protein
MQEILGLLIGGAAAGLIFLAGWWLLSKLF